MEDGGHLLNARWEYILFLKLRKSIWFTSDGILAILISLLFTSVALANSCNHEWALNSKMVPLRVSWPRIHVERALPSGNGGICLKQWFSNCRSHHIQQKDLLKVIRRPHHWCFCLGMSVFLTISQVMLKLLVHRSFLEDYMSRETKLNSQVFQTRINRSLGSTE